MAKKIYPPCDRSDCFGERAGCCNILNSTVFEKGCPFYKHRDSVDQNQIAADIAAYKAIYGGGHDSQ